MGDSSSDVRCHTKNIKSRYIIFKSCSRRKTETYISFGDKTQRENVENGTRTFYKHNASQQQNIPHFSKRSASCRCRKQLQNEFSFVTVHENRVVNGIIVCVFMVNTTTSYYYDIQNKFKGIFNLTRKRNKTHFCFASDVNPPPGRTKLSFGLRDNRFENGYLIYSFATLPVS